ncbi:rhodanese-like domain-containing protein [Mesonia sp.]|uniref:rhodanese-like domain-containing protein n=1 Tax=Mesonia sp. TaxID=1960830 RepID=UPI00175CCF85|nr:rhodanese-like domain-containing protein [Mesonia sp.]HIB36123.1 rhodanese-like domain-containing protein [Mesonia sp.]HIO27985.1 rhodanese-like domain-containing protein [Flavobacteriaceae bacterium]
MKFRILYISVSLLIIATTFSCKEGIAQEETIEMITPDEADKLSKMDEVQLLDVRTEAEFGEEHLLNAQNIVYDESFSEKIEDLDKEKPVIVYCKSGGRSEKCAQILKDSGFVKIYDIKGGITEWKFKGKKTEK